MKCKRCGQEREHNNRSICGSCADDLRQEQEAMQSDIEYEMNKQAYEETLRTGEETLDDYHF